jgi:hypothetical protein
MNSPFKKSKSCRAQMNTKKCQIIVIQSPEIHQPYTVYTHIIVALFWQIFSTKNGDAKIMRAIFGRRYFRGDFQVMSGIGYPIHKLEMKHFSVII